VIEQLGRAARAEEEPVERRVVEKLVEETTIDSIAAP